MTFELYKDVAGQWRWRLKAANGEVVATSGGDGYHNKGDCADSIGLVMTHARNAQLVDLG